MRRNPFAPLPLLVMLILLAVGLPARAACTAGNPNANVIESTPTGDFTVNGNGTVTHSRTGLMWKQCSEGQTWNGSICAGTATTTNWANALKAANTANTAAFGGYTDWRLPNKKELASVVELCGYNPAINQTAFPSAPASNFWSGSSAVSNPTKKWSVDFYDGAADFGIKTDDDFVRLVRGGQSVDSFDLLASISTTPSDCLFNWAESAYPTLFAPAATSNTLAPYYYRYYSQTNAYLGASSADNHVYYFGPASNNSLFDLGALSTWLATVSCQ